MVIKNIIGVNSYYSQFVIRYIVILGTRLNVVLGSYLECSPRINN